MYVTGEAPFYDEIDANEGKSHRVLHSNSPFPGTQRYLCRVSQPQILLVFLPKPHQVFLQTHYADCAFHRSRCFGIYCHVSRRPRRRARQTSRVCVLYFLSACILISFIFRGIYAAIASFLMFSMIQFRDGPYIRPHPAFWRIVLGINLLYELALVFLLFQDLHSARRMMMILDPTLNVPLPEKSYAENCALTTQNILVSLPDRRLSNHLS